MAYTREELNNMGIHSLRVILRSDFKGVPGTSNKQDLINLILKTQAGEEIPVRSTKGRKPLDVTVSMGDRDFVFSDVGEGPNGETCWTKGVFEKHENGYGYVRGEDCSITKNDAFVRETFVKRAGLKTGDIVEGECDGYGDRGGYTLRNSAFVNGKALDDGANKEDTTPLVKPVKEKINLGGQDGILNAVDTFCPIGKGQRCMVVGEDNAFTTDLTKRLLKAINDSGEDLSVTALLVGAKPEIAVELKESFSKNVVLVDFNEDASVAVRICKLAIQSVKNKVKNGRHHVLIIDRISAVLKCLREYLAGDKTDKFISENINAERFILDAFGCGGNMGEEKSLTIFAVANDLEDGLYKNLLEVSNAVINLKGEGKIRKRSYKLDVQNSWSDSDEILHGAEKISRIDSLREEMCSSLEKEESIWQKFKNGEIKL